MKRRRKGIRAAGIALAVLLAGVGLGAGIFRVAVRVRPAGEIGAGTPPPAVSAELPPTPEPTPEPTPDTRLCIVIDPGHQRHGSPEPEPIGPGALETKARVADGTEGVVSGLAEYELNLTVALQLRDELTARGYRVVLTREEHDVDLSNAERAAIAAEAGADVFLRIHANASDRSTDRGVMTVCMSPSNPFHPELYESSLALSEQILAGVTASTGARSMGVWETDSMSGINWSTVPVTILEMGFMSNPEEDLLLADADYQRKIVQGIADGLDAYFTSPEP